MPRKPAISKSSFIRGKQCLKSLVLLKRFPELRDRPSDSKIAVFERGHRVGELAQQLFPGGRLAAFELPQGFMKSIRHTSSLIAKNESVLYEAGFMYGNFHCFVDILKREHGKWHIYEVKSSTGVSETYLYDAAFQLFVLQGSGLEVGGVSIIHVNNHYVRQGQLEPKKLFSLVNVTDQVVALQEEIGHILEGEAAALEAAEVPDIPIGAHCFDPYDCDFMGHCWQEVPDYSVFNVTRLEAGKKFELFRQGYKLPRDIPADFPLSENQQIQVGADRSGRPIIHRQAIRHFLEGLRYPLYFLDFETFNPAIPRYDRSCPYQQIPFQYSLHILEKPGDTPQHAAFLGSPGEDPRPGLIRQLLRETKEPGDIIVYNKGFESGRINEMIRDFPEFEAPLKKRSDRLVDLMNPFRQKHYYTPAMQGSYSIKNVLPALVPGFSYAVLEIGNGTDASLAFETLLEETDPAIIKNIRNDLLAYCKLDTLAMVEILRVLEGV